MLGNMVVELTPFAVALAAVILSYWIWKAVKWVWWRPKKLEQYLRQQGLSGNSYRLLFGDTKERSMIHKQALSEPLTNFSNDILPRIDPFLHRTISHYGKDSFIWNGPVPMIYITNPELIKEVFSRMNDFLKPKVNPLMTYLVPGLVSYEGEKWAKHRKLINPAFHKEKLKIMLPAFYDCCSSIVEEWKKMTTESAVRLASQEVDVQPYFERLSSDAISRAAFGSSYEEGRKIFELLKEQNKIIINRLQSIYIPGWRYLPTKANRRINGLEDEIQTLLTGIINNRKMEMDAGIVSEDLLGILMESAGYKLVNGNVSKRRLEMTTKELIEECKVFYIAGQETTSVLLEWTMILLGKHQEWQTRAREEVLSMFGKSRPDFDGLNHLKIVTMILYEVLRLYPPIVFLGRTVSKDTKLGKLSLPKGVSVNLLSIVAHRDTEIWGDDVNEFRPDRFADGTSHATKGHMSFVPFGGGPRICIGQNFALVEAKMALAMILQNFTFDLSPSYLHVPCKAFSLTLSPLYGIPIILQQV